MTRVAIFDRDATIIDIVRDEELGAVSVAFHPRQLKFLDGAIEGMRALQEAGFVLAIATNQPAPAKGQFSAEAVKRTNQALLQMLAERGIEIAALEACLHHPEGGSGGDPALVGPCECRKPKPGMLLSILRRFDADRSRSWMIGDSLGDVQADERRAQHRARQPIAGGVDVGERDGEVGFHRQGGAATGPSPAGRSLPGGRSLRAWRRGPALGAGA